MNRDDGEIEERLRRHYQSSLGPPPDPVQIKQQVAQRMEVQTTGGISHQVQQPFARNGSGGGLGPRSLLATSAAVVVVALLAGLLIFARPGGPSRPSVAVTETTTATAVPTIPLPSFVPLTCGSTSANPSSAGTPVDHSVAIGSHVTVHGITLTIDRAYADATETSITYQIQSTNGEAPSLNSPVLIDAQGNRYGPFAGDGAGYRGTDTEDSVFEPLPLQDLGTTQTLTFFGQQVDLFPLSAPAAPSVVQGPWQISFNLTPAAGVSVPLSSPPITHNGVTVQPLRIDVATAGGGLEDMAGGARVIVRISGLAPGTLLSDVGGFKSGVTHLRLGGTSYGCGGGILELVLPNGQQIAPGAVLPLGVTVPVTPVVATPVGQQPQTVGPSGTVEVEALFFQPIPTGSSAILYVDQVGLQSAGEAQPVHISGPWAFLLPPGV